MNTTLQSVSASAVASPTVSAATTASGRIAPPASSDAAAADSIPLETPKPLRFPWLSRLSLELEPSAKQKSTFASAPVLGDNVDKKA